MLASALRARAQVVREIRAYFDGLGFTEVETPVRIAAPAPEPHIDCPQAAPGYLRASPELQMKKILAQGLDLIYEIGPCFREGEKGSRHNPEFTMIEWYRLHADYLDILRDTEGLLRHLTGKNDFACTHLTVREAYRRYAGWDPFESFDQDRFDYDMATRVEPNLPKGYVFLMDYPKSCASLARLSGDHAERWELYHDGLELGNCFTELCDEAEQRARFAAARTERRQLGEADYPLDEEFLASLPLVGSAAGVAIGVDRLLMVLLGAKTIADVRVLD